MHCPINWIKNTEISFPQYCNQVNNDAETLNEDGEPVDMVTWDNAVMNCISKPGRKTLNAGLFPIESQVKHKD